jgi:hypothetical protein
MFCNIFFIKHCVLDKMQSTSRVPELGMRQDQLSYSLPTTIHKSFLLGLYPS